MRYSRETSVELTPTKSYKSTKCTLVKNTQKKVVINKLDKNDEITPQRRPHEFMGTGALWYPWTRLVLAAGAGTSRGRYDRYVFARLLRPTRLRVQHTTMIPTNTNPTPIDDTMMIGIFSFRNASFTLPLLG